MKKPKYYRLDNILKENCQYNMILGERSNGKTYAVLERGIQRYAQTGEQMAIIRRWYDDFKGKRGASMFQNLEGNKVIEKATGGKWTNVYYFSSRWFFCRYDKETDEQGVETGKVTRVVDATPFCYAFAISGMEHDKSTSYPEVTTILFDEFMTRGYYLPDEFVLFMNVLSTIIRLRDNVTIFMCGNTVNKYCPYFNEMGLTHVKQMKQGDIEVYHYGNSGLKVAVEFSDSPNKSKPSDLYFAFDNPKLAMITGQGGVWEIAIYPHCPVKFSPKDIVFTYFIQFSGDLLQCEIVHKDKNYFTFIHRKTTELRHPEKDFIYTPDHDPKPNTRRKITKPVTNLEKKIVRFFQMDKVFYQDNEVGEIVRNYLMWCKGGE